MEICDGKKEENEMREIQGEALGGGGEVGIRTMYVAFINQPSTFERHYHGLSTLTFKWPLRQTEDYESKVAGGFTRILEMGEKQRGTLQSIFWRSVRVS